MADSRGRGWRILFWVLLVLFLLKIVWYIFFGAVWLVWMATWLMWVSALLGLVFFGLLYRYLFGGSIGCTVVFYWLILLVVVMLIGLGTKSLKWTGTWQWRGSKTTGSTAVLGTTSWGANLIACQTTASTPVESLPAGMTMKISSKPYYMVAGNPSPLYDSEGTGFTAPAISLSKINTPSKDAYTEADLPEGDIFFRVQGAQGFSQGYAFDMQVCSTDNRMLASEELSYAPSIYTAEQAKNVTAITQYLWHNKRVWAPGQYVSFGYYYGLDAKWHLVTRTPEFTIK